MTRLRWSVKHEDDEWGDAIEIPAHEAIEAAEAAAQQFWDFHDGWERMKNGAVFDCRAGASAPVKIRIYTEFEPTFAGYPEQEESQ